MPEPLTMTTQDANRSFLPSQVHELITRPVTAASVALQVAQVVRTEAHVHEYRVPIVTADPSASWTGEGETFAVTGAELTETASPFFKLGGLTIISRELAEDSSPDATAVVGAGLARDIARKVDSAYFGSKGASLVTPTGLEDLAGVHVVAAGSAWSNTDPFAEAIYEAEARGATLNAFVANPADALLLAKVKKASGSNEPLLGNDPTQATRRTIAGVPLLVSPAVTVGTIWGIPSGQTIVAMREDVNLEVNRSAHFASDKIAIRASFRATFLFPHEAAIQKVKLSA